MGQGEIISLAYQASILVLLAVEITHNAEKAYYMS